MPVEVFVGAPGTQRTHRHDPDNRARQKFSRLSGLAQYYPLRSVYPVCGPREPLASGSSHQKNRSESATGFCRGRSHVCALHRDRGTSRRRGASSWCGIVSSDCQIQASRAEAHLKRLEPCNDKPRTAYKLRLTIVDNLNVAPTHIARWHAPPARRGFHETAHWFEVRAKAGRSHLGRFRRALEPLR